jgi:hypothetical protein
MNLSMEEIERKLCESCDKMYPKNYLTRYRRKKK